MLTVDGRKAVVRRGRFGFEKGVTEVKLSAAAVFVVTRRESKEGRRGV
jgi:hypothetical protein